MILHYFSKEPVDIIVPINNKILLHDRLAKALLVFRFIMPLLGSASNIHIIKIMLVQVRKSTLK